MALLGPNIDDLRANGDVDGLVEALDWIGIDRGRQAAVALAKLGDPRAVPPLIAALDAAVQKQKAKSIVAAAEALARFRDGRAAEPLVQAMTNAPFLFQLKDSERKEVVVAVAKSLQVMGEVSTEALVEALGQEEFRVRAFSADILGEIGSARAVEPLLSALQDANPRVRLGAAEALAKMPDASLEGLVEALEAEDTTLREAATDALLKIGNSEATEALAKSEHGRLALERKSVKLAVTPGREYRFPERCLYCGGPEEVTQRIGVWVEERALLDLPYCTQHRKEAKRNAAIFYASLVLIGLVMMTLVLLIVVRGGGSPEDLFFVGLVGFAGWLGLMWLTWSILSRRYPSMKDTSLSNLTLGFKSSYAAGVLTVGFTNLEIAREFERLNGLPRTPQGAGE